MYKYILTHFAIILLSINSALAEGQVMLFDDHDPEMNAAIEEARSNLPLFLEKIYEEEYADVRAGVKVALATYDNGQEHIWVSPIWKTESGFSGNLVNEPVNIPNVSYGSEVNFTIDQISDWSIVIGDVRYGHYTTRVIIPRLDKATAKQIRASLSDNPLPQGW